MPTVQRGWRRLGGTGEDLIRDDDGQILGIVTAGCEADLNDEDVRCAVDMLGAALKEARARRGDTERRTTVPPPPVMLARQGPR